MVTSTSSIPASSATTTSSTSTLSSDVYNKVEQVMTSQSAGVTKLNNSLTADQTTISALGQLQSALADFQSVAQSLAGAGLSMAATSSASGILSATTSDQAATGSHTVDVQQLAQGQALSSAVQASPTSAIGSGASTVIKIASASGASQSITINNTNNSLQGIAGALQAAGVNAQVVQGSGGYALTIVGASGAANGMSISVSGDASIQGLMAYDPAGGKGMTQTAAAQDAVLTVDGKQVSSPTNSVGGAIAGTTLALSGTGSTTLTVAQDSSQIASNVASLASAYNTLNAKLQTLQGGDLQSDTAVNQASSQLTHILKTGGSGFNSVSVSALAQAGITLDSSGNMQVDNTKLASAIAADPAGVGQLFSNGGSGIVDQMASVAGTLNGASGIVQTGLTTANNDFSKLTTQKATLATAMTAQANALAALYTQQESDAAASSSSGGVSSLFDLMA